MTSPSLLPYFLTTHYATMFRKMYKPLNHFIHPHAALMTPAAHAIQQSGSLIMTSLTAFSEVHVEIWWISLGKAGRKGLALIGWIDFLLTLALRLKWDSQWNWSRRSGCYLEYWWVCLLQAIAAEENSPRCDMFLKDTEVWLCKSEHSCSCRLPYEKEKHNI